MRQKKTSRSGILWHPHQGLWNGQLFDAVRKKIPFPLVQKMIFFVIVQIDTFILLLRALERRATVLGISGLFIRVHLPDDISLIYLDLGTHKEGKELGYVLDHVLPQVSSNYIAYGFEASQASFLQAAEKFSDKDNVHLIHKALCHQLPASGKVRLYRDSDSGIADSMYRESPSYEEVEAGRLSDFLLENDLIQESNIILLRMNIEGAEYDVIEDLIESGLAGEIDGYFGMWDDVSKIDPERDQEFRTLLSKHQISSFTFNGRDMRWFLRKRIISYHMKTQIQAGMKRIERLKVEG